jgi:hypothetical protein
MQFPALKIWRSEFEYSFVPGTTIIRLPLFLYESLTLKTAGSICDNQWYIIFNQSVPS